MPKPKHPSKLSQKNNPEQSRLFIEKAREIEADQQRSRADELLGHLASKPPEPRKNEK